MGIRYLIADWDKHKEQLSSVRYEVFVVGQNVPPELERDEADRHYNHILALDGEKPVGAARLTNDGYIGRVAVLEEYRGMGIGRELIRQLEEVAFELGFNQVELGAQLHALPFYEKMGYQAFGDIYMDAGIEHRHMKKNI